jgi:hypothetical protein
MSTKALLSLLITINLATYGQSQKACEPLHITFHNFQKKSVNLTVGLGMQRTVIDRKNSFAFNGIAGLNYFPVNYLEFGWRIKPAFANFKPVGPQMLLENSLYVRYYPLFVTCLKSAFFGGASVSRDGSAYSLKGESISRNIIFPSADAGILILLGRSIQVEACTNIFINRQSRHSVGLLFNLKNFTEKKSSQVWLIEKVAK